jgi:predicted unusual protein kinase regulating ubiquinone biosynthesis (AarF/ABC1/UbiB family)
MIIIPDVILEQTSKHVLTIYVPANKITDVAALDATGIDREKLVIQTTLILSKILLRHIIFHTDHHPCKISQDFVSIITIIITVY